MRLPRVRFTVREVMIANLAVGILLAWIVSWEQRRVRMVREAARAILAEDTNDPFSGYYGSPREAVITESQRVAESARM
jgi:hypothetical protein